jgi:hypothetical protein
VQHDEDDDSMPGQDSFIDVICNMVGILIVLVTIFGMRASQAPAEGPSAKSCVIGSNGASRSLHSAHDIDVAKLQAELDDALRLAHQTENEANTAIVQAVDLRLESQLLEAQREELTLTQAIVESKIAERRAKLDADGQRQFDVQRNITAAQIRLHELTQEQVSLLSAPAEIAEIECVPTPLAKTVTGQELHIRLKHGQLAVVPDEALLKEAYGRGADYLRTGLSQHEEAQDTYGPINGFRMRYSVEKYEEVLPGPSPLTPARRTALVHTAVFLPTNDNLGQDMEQALLPSSPFMQALRAKRSGAPAVIAWVYPDSYAELRSLKKALWEAAIPLAVRPLSEGKNIVFSTAGTKSEAQ